MTISLYLALIYPLSPSLFLLTSPVLLILLLSYHMNSCVHIFLNSAYNRKMWYVVFLPYIIFSCSYNPNCLSLHLCFFLPFHRPQGYCISQRVVDFSLAFHRSTLCTWSNPMLPCHLELLAFSFKHNYFWKMKIIIYQESPPNKNASNYSSIAN